MHAVSRKRAGRFARRIFSNPVVLCRCIGDECENRYRPRIAIKHIDGKRALKGFTARRECDSDDLIPEESVSGEPESGYKFRGNFLDLRTLAFALSDKSYSLASDCEAFAVEHGKQRAARPGEICDEYIDYNRRDVLATAELAAKLFTEYDKHPINLQPTKAYSPASIGKSYLEAMGVGPILERQPDFPKAYLGYAQSAFFGGRTSAHIRKTPVPVVYTDFLSMYPTVNSLMGLWQFVTARKIAVIEHCGDEVSNSCVGYRPSDCSINRPGRIWRDLFRSFQMATFCPRAANTVSRAMTGRWQSITSIATPTERMRCGIRCRMLPRL